MEISATDQDRTRTSALSRYVRKIRNSVTRRIVYLTFLGMLLGWAADILIAAKLGTSQASDALIVALSLPLLIDTVVREGTRSSMVPLIIEKIAALSREEFNRFLSGMINLALLAGSALVLLIELFSPEIISVIAPGFTAEKREEAARLLRICGPLVFFALANSFLSVVLNCQRNFGVVALRNAIASGVVLSLILIAWRNGSLAAWVSAAYVIGFSGFFLSLAAREKGTGFRYSWRSWITKKELISIGSAASLPAAGFFVLQLTRIAERLIASLVAAGGVAVYYFAFRIFSAIQTLIGTSMSTTGLPEMTELHLSGNNDRMTAVIRNKLVNTLFVVLPVFLLIAFFHEELIGVVYGRGSFGGDSIRQTSTILFWLNFGLAFNCVVPVLESGLYAQKSYRIILITMTATSGMNITLAWLLSGIWGLPGIAIALSLTVVATALLLTFFLHRSGIPVLRKRSPRP